MGPRKWTPKWGPETGPQNGVLKVDPKMEPLSWKCFDFFLISTTGPLAGCISWTPVWAQFLDPHFGAHFLEPLFGPHNGSKKQKFLFCVANIFGSKEAENHIYCADLMVTLKRMDEYNARMFEGATSKFQRCIKCKCCRRCKKETKSYTGEAPCHITGFCGKK